MDSRCWESTPKGPFRYSSLQILLLLQHLKREGENPRAGGGLSRSTSGLSVDEAKVVGGGWDGEVVGQQLEEIMHETLGSFY